VVAPGCHIKTVKYRVVFLQLRTYRP